MKRITITDGAQLYIGKDDSSVWHELLDNIRDAQEKEVMAELKNTNDWAEYILRNFAKPKINGEITAGKLRWRGIYKREIFDDFSHTIELWQHKEKLGSYTIEYKHFNPINKNGVI
jgi:hypothetical protein